jgi:predicted dehydrogenase
MGPIRLGVIGCGGIARWMHLRIARRMRGAMLIATADPDPQARACADSLTGVPSLRSADELLARPDIDAVIITAPPHLHADLVIAAIAAGKHVYVEKPLASSLDDGARVVDAVRRTAATIVLGYNRRFHPLFGHARELLRRGRIGRVKAVQTTFSEPAQPDAMPEWKRRRATGGGVLLDLASHHIDLLRWFLGDEVASVGATIDSELTDHDGAHLHLTMRGGTHVQSSFSCRIAISDAFEFAGERGTLRVDRHRRAVSLRLPRRFGYGMRTGWAAPPSSVTTWWVERLVQPSRESSYRRALEAFVSVLRGGARPHNVADVNDGMRALEVIEAAEQSARFGRVIDLDSA